jgi:hypothetical protein
MYNPSNGTYTGCVVKSTTTRLGRMTHLALLTQLALMNTNKTKMEKVHHNVKPICRDVITCVFA